MFLDEDSFTSTESSLNFKSDVGFKPVNSNLYLQNVVSKTSYSLQDSDR